MYIIFEYDSKIYIVLNTDMVKYGYNFEYEYGKI